MAAKAVNRWRPDRNYSRCRRRLAAILTRGLNNDAHSISPNHRDRSVWRDEFALRDHVNNLVDKTRLAAWTQDRQRDASVPGKRSTAVANSRGTPANDGPGGFVVRSAKRR